MKSTSLTIKTRTPKLGEFIEIETTGGWERVRISGASGPIGGIYDTLTITFDDESSTKVFVDNINWRRPPT